MNPRERIRAVIGRRRADRCGFWIGVPSPAMQRELQNYFGAGSLEGVYRALGDDIRWINPQYLASTYRSPDGSVMRPWKEVNPHGLAGGPLAGAQSPAQVEEYAWPRAEYCCFEEALRLLSDAGPYYRLSGFWSPFFHDLTYLFGAEELLVKMCMTPEVVHAALGRVCSFYLDANERFFAQAGGLVDALFFGNDFGTQSDLLMDPGQFREFFLPWVRAFCDQAHRFGLHSVLHTCGAVSRIIPDLIAAGVDCLHPLQARAAGMDAKALSAYAGRIAFMGGIDTQELLLRGSAEQVTEEVRRVNGILGPHLVVGPSHEAMLPGIPPANVEAMARAAGAFPG